jgi:tol-pal system protein YbgF
MSPASNSPDRSLGRQGLLVAVWLGCMAVTPAHAQLFGDDEARKAIIDLRNRVEADRRANEAQFNRIEQDVARQNEENNAPTRRSLLDLSNQIEALRGELARSRGQAEQLARDVAEMQRQQKDALVSFDERLRQLEPAVVSLDGQQFKARATEKSDFDQAMELVRKASFDASAKAFTAFVKRYPDSGYLPAAWFWLGNSQYAVGAFKEAIDSYRLLLSRAPDHARVPEARLAIANCQMELKDTRSAKRTLEDVVKLHPQSEAAVTAKERLARMH